jgi:phosphatidylglycerophosphatase A
VSIAFPARRSPLKKSTDPTGNPKTATDHLAVFVATAGGAGFLPKAPGTAGAVVGVLVYLALHAAGAGAYFLHAILGILFAGTLAAQRVEAFWGHDSQRIVIDEVVGQMIAFGLAGGARLSWASLVVGFVLFRAFDIVKPFPVRHLERLPGGAGVMADDVGAGLYALAVLTLLQHLFDI